MAAADRVETRSGVVYSNAVALRVDAKGLVIRHAGGITTIPIEEIAVLSDGLMERQKQAQAREADRRALMEARRAAMRQRWEACRLLYDELGERRTFAVLRKLRSADHRADMQSSSNLLYEINLGDRLRRVRPVPRVRGAGDFGVRILPGHREEQGDGPGSLRGVSGTASLCARARVRYSGRGSTA